MAVRWKERFSKEGVCGLAPDPTPGTEALHDHASAAGCCRRLDESRSVNRLNSLVMSQIGAGEKCAESSVGRRPRRVRPYLRERTSLRAIAVKVIGMKPRLEFSFS